MEYCASQNRRNRINEKLKALQDLIPNSTKVCKFQTSLSVHTLIHIYMYVVHVVIPLILLFTKKWLLQTDKASVLDEAIEYMKSLQMQLQVTLQL